MYGAIHSALHEELPTSVLISKCLIRLNNISKVKVKLKCNLDIFLINFQDILYFGDNYQKTLSDSYCICCKSNCCFINPVINKAKDSLLKLHAINLWYLKSFYKLLSNFYAIFFLIFLSGS